MGTVEHKILITGSNGLLGQKIVKRCINKNIPFLATSLGENRNKFCPESSYVSLDITSREQIEELFKANQFKAVIHTAALTNVDYCELNPTECHKVNVVATEYLFQNAQKVNCHFQLLSTDFVFDGEKGNYNEDDSVAAISVYGQSKVDAENLILRSNYTNFSIARTIIVYGTGENLSRSNLILWALDALPKKEPMKLVNDQFRAPTWADDLAYGCIEIIERNKTGVFHLSGPITRPIDEIVRVIANELGINNPSIETISSLSLNQPAKRPPVTGFDLSKAQNEIDFRPKDIPEALSSLIDELR